VSLGTRRVVFLVAGSAVAILLLWGFSGLPRFGRYAGSYGLLLDRVGVPERHVTEVVTAVVFDYRGVDTMGEEAILFAAVAGVLVLLRPTREEEEWVVPVSGEPEGSIAISETVRAAGRALGPVAVLFAIYVVAHGHLTPGGGFQGGAVLAGAWVLSYLAGGYGAFQRVSPLAPIDLAEGVGVILYPAIGALGLLTGGAFLTNVLPLGSTGSLLSGGTIPILNAAVGMAVAAGFVLILAEFLEQALAIRPKERRR
jgi:multicomponent Na+:H+ antiporter subunit B